MNDLVELAQGVGSILKEDESIRKKFSNALVQPIIQPLGEAGGILFRVLPVALRPLEGWIDKKNLEAAQRKMYLSLHGHLATVNLGEVQFLFGSLLVKFLISSRMAVSSCPTSTG